MSGALDLVQVSKSFGQVVAVADVTLSVRAGEFLTLLGPSGSGKTTTLMVIAGFEEPDRGRIVLDGIDITHVPSYRRGLGVSFQHYALFPHMTVFENVAFALKMRDLGGAEIGARVSEALELVRLRGLEDRYPRQLSGGQQQRVALARALVFRPPVLLLDEPLGALDRMLREEMQIELRRMHERLGTTTIYVTHDQQEALVMSDRIAVMNAGRIEQLGTPDEIYDRPSSRFVAAFIGESNFLAGRIGAITDGIAQVRVGELEFQAPADPGLARDQAVFLTIRPERLVIGRAAPPGSPSFPGTVDDVIYLGDAIKCVVRLAGGVSVTVKRQRASAHQAIARGDAVTVAYAIADASLFPGAGGGSGLSPNRLLPPTGGPTRGRPLCRL